MDPVRTDLFTNPAAKSWRADPVSGVGTFHRSLPGYIPTRLVEVPELAEELAVRRVFVKEESARLGLPAFKILGASYAIARTLGARFGIEPVATLDELRTAVAAHGPVELIAATDGNHGRAVAHMARLLGLSARIFYPADSTGAAKAAILGEGAEGIELALAYDDIVATARAAAEVAGDAAVLVQDTSWPGYEQIPHWIVDGYSTLFEEADEQLGAAGARAPLLVAVPVGVGSLAQAAVRHYRSRAGEASVLSVEPVNAPAIIASLHAGRSVSVPTRTTIMAGLNCGTPSEIAWPVLQSGLDVAITVTDEQTTRSTRDLERFGIDAGPCGAASLAGVRALASAEPLDPDVTILLVSTEGRSANPLPEGD